MNKLILIAMLTMCISAYADTLPNPKLTPGNARNVDQVTLCTTSTKLVRNVPETEKKAIYKQYNLTGNHTGYCKDTLSVKDEGCEVDHLISLELGGSNDITNLWPQPYFGDWNAHTKDKFENFLHAQVCSNKMSMTQAQKEISSNWITNYKTHPELMKVK